MKVLIDMNLSPIWEEYLRINGYEAIHWIKIGAPNAPDKIIFEYARAHGFIVFTHDLDFGAILAATNADAPSVFQVRTQDLTPQNIGEKVIYCLNKFAPQLLVGCMLTLDDARSKVRLLPFGN